MRTFTAHMADGTGTLREVDDRTLLREFVGSRSAVAFEELVRRNADMVYSAARRQMGGAELAEDVAQAVFLVLARKAQKVDGVLAGWLLGVTFNACRNAKRMAARRAYHERRAGVMKLQAAPSDPEIEWNDYAPVVDVAMHRLRREDRDLIAMRFFRGSSFKDVGASLGINEEAARKRVERAIGRLRAALSERAAAPAVAILASHLSTKAIEAAPAKLVEVIGTSLASGAKGTVAGTIASKTAHAMTLVKIKVAAAIILTVGAVGVGTGAAIKLVSQTGVPTAMAPAPPPPVLPAQPAPGTVQQIRLSPEGQFPGETQLVQWSVLLSDGVSNAIRPMGRPVQTASTGYETYLFNGGMLRATLALNMRGTNVIAEAGSMQYARPAGLNGLAFQSSAGQMYVMNPQNNGIAFQAATFLGTSDTKRIGDGVRIKLDYPQVSLMAGTGTRPDNIRWGAGRQASIEFDGQLALGDALGLMARVVAPGGKAMNYLVVFETFRLRQQEGLLNEVNSSAWWIVHGPQTLRQLGDAAYVWKQNSAPDETHLSALPSIALEDGKTLQLVGLSRPSQWAECWWDAAGNSTEPLDGQLLPGGEPPEGLWACVMVEGPKGENRIQRPVATDSSPDRPFRAWGSGKVLNDSSPLTVGVLVGPWRELARMRSGESTVVEGVTYRIARNAETTNPYVKIGRQGAIDDIKQRIEYVAVTRDGKEVSSEDYPPAISIGKKQPWDGVSDRPHFMSIKFSDISYFRILARKRQWVSFGEFAAVPRLTPPASVSEGDVEKAMALAARNGDQAMLNEIISNRAKWQAIAADPTVPSGAARLLFDLAERGDAKGVREMIFATDPQMQPELDSIARYLTQCAMNRKNLVDRFGDVAVQSQADNVCPDIEREFVQASWQRNGDGSYAQEGGIEMKKLADGKFHFDFDALATPETLETMKKMIEMEEGVAARLAKNPPPTLEEIKSYGRVMATTQGTN